MYQAMELGGYTDNVGTGRSSSLFATFQVGVKAGPEVGFYGKAFLGAGGITTTDSLLGGRFQFMEEVGFGIRDTKTFVEWVYCHVSSAGISSPNQGRDFIAVGAGIRL